MKCQSCGKEHENSKGLCPFCYQKTAVVKRTRERPSEISGGIFACKDCGGEMMFVPNPARKPGKIWHPADDIAIHKSSKTIKCPDKIKP